MLFSPLKFVIVRKRDTKEIILCKQEKKLQNYVAG
jgi:hypothetical protein